MIPPHIRLSHYKREDVRKALVEEAQRKEVAVRFDDSFGKRPDVLAYERDVLELAKNGATSFHASEELWSNVLQLSPGMRREELDALRIGWDLVLDVDCPKVELSKLIAASLVAALQREGVTSISAKYSGNRGFHIAVPWEAFPPRIGDKDVRREFPEYPKRIMEYLVSVVELHIISVEGENVNFGGTGKDKKAVAALSGIPESELFVQECMRHHIRLRGGREEKHVFVCKSCTKEFSGQVEECTNCRSKFIKEEILEVKEANHCGCASINFKPVLDVRRILNLDALLLSSRHMYRMAYSLHEKTNRVSLVVEPDTLADFDVSSAEQQNFLMPAVTFLDRSNAHGDAEELLKKALDYSFVATTKEPEEPKEYVIPEEAIPEELFPDCIRKILAGMEDGRKRSLFILVNFLSSVGWDHDAIEKRIEEWNKANKEPLREVNIKSHLRYHRQQGAKMPPNCHNKAYYQDLGVKCSEEICSLVRNPVGYAKRKKRAGPSQPL